LIQGIEKSSLQFYIVMVRLPMNIEYEFQIGAAFEFALKVISMPIK
jgi:hypothetical protein